VLLCDRLARKGINVIVRASVRRHRSGQPHITVKLYALSRHLASKIAIAAAYRRAARPSSPPISRPISPSGRKRSRTRRSRASVD